MMMYDTHLIIGFRNMKCDNIANLKILSNFVSLEYILNLEFNPNKSRYQEIEKTNEYKKTCTKSSEISTYINPLNLHMKLFPTSQPPLIRLQYEGIVLHWWYNI